VTPEPIVDVVLRTPKNLASLRATQSCVLVGGKSGLDHLLFHALEHLLVREGEPTGRTSWSGDRSQFFSRDDARTVSDECDKAPLSEMWAM